MKEGAPLHTIREQLWQIIPNYAFWATNLISCQQQTIIKPAVLRTDCSSQIIILEMITSGIILDSLQYSRNRCVDEQHLPASSCLNRMRWNLVPWCSSWPPELPLSSFGPLELPCPPSRLLWLPAPSLLCWPELSEPELLPPFAPWLWVPAPLPVLSSKDTYSLPVGALLSCSRSELTPTMIEYSAVISLSTHKRFKPS